MIDDLMNFLLKNILLCYSQLCMCEFLCEHYISVLNVESRAVLICVLS